MSEESKIDPGPGYRLLGHKEDIISGDEEVNPNTHEWRPIGSGGPTLFRAGYAFRRKIPKESKPFTPNKYTRWVPTLDGLTAPVDVYGVSEAFDIRSHFTSAGAVEAILHGRKKLLAPGQRGTKSALQDIKEARDSLNRAIALEEATLERGNKG